jgi:hypothetical protein
MKKQNILLIILFAFFISANAQLQFLDNYNIPISNVKLFSKEGRILAISNFKGETKTSKITFPKKDSIEIYHSNYISKKMIWDDLRKKSKVYLIADSITKLEEIILTAKKPEFLILKGYFISYQIVDDVALSFSDGIIEYYVNLKKNKFVDSRIIESRVFKNNDSIKAFSKRKGNSTFNILSTIPPFSFYEEVLINDWDNYKTESDGIIKKKNSIIGRITKNSNTSEFTIEYNSPQNTKKTSIFGITSVIKNKSISEKFNSKSPKINNISSVGKYYNSDITKKGVSINYELIQDLYITEKKYLSKEKIKEYRKKIKNEPKNIYLGNTEISVIPKFIESMFNKNLELISNKE